jgi:intracellular septation protein
MVLDFLPILLFFIAYKSFDIYIATAVLMAATVVQMGLVYLMDRKLQLMHQVTLVLILAFGSLTLVLHDDTFIKWKPTLLYSGLAIGLALALWVFKKSYLKLLLGAHLQLPDPVWMRLNVAWIAYSLFMASLNAYVAIYYSTDTWVNFKLWGYVFPITFIVAQGLYIAPFLRQAAAKPDQPKH